MKNVLIVIISLLALRVAAQNDDSGKFLDTEFYLVDSIPIDRVSEVDRQLLDSTLHKYHKEDNDTTKINLLEHIIEQSWNIEIWPRYNLYFKGLVEKALQEELNPEMKYWYSSKLAQSINNVGFFHNSHGAIAKAIMYYEEGLEMQLAIGDSASSGATYNNIGGAYMFLGELDSAMFYYTTAKELYEKLNFEEQLVHPLLNIAYLYNLQGNVHLALEYYTQSLKYAQQSDNYQGMTSSLLNLGVIYKNQKDYEKAIEYLEKAIENSQKIGYKEGESSAINNLGAVFSEMGNTQKSKEYYEKSAMLFKEIEDWQGYASALINIGRAIEKDEPEKALSYYQEGLALYEKIEYQEGMANVYNSIGEYYLTVDDLIKAEEYGQKSLELARHLGYPSVIRDAAQLLSRVYDETNNRDDAYDMYRLYIAMRDSTYNMETQKAAIKQETKYQYDRQKILDEAAHQKEIAIKEKEKEKQQVITYAVVVGLILVIAFLIFIYNRLQIMRRQKEIIEEQKEEVETQRDRIDEQKQIVEEAHKEIQDSIIYAQRIQKAILPADELWQKTLPPSFILYQPKDVVAGDFYWMEPISGLVPDSLSANPHTIKEGQTPQQTSNNSVVLFAVADCTGHGVPGAMVSVVCHNALNRSVREFRLTEPGLILDKTREIVVAEFEKSEDDVKDGMDIALCSLHKKDGTWKLQYAGAHNPLWIVRKNQRHGSMTKESVDLKNSDSTIRSSSLNDEFFIMETKADKQPIGKFDKPTPYITNEIELKKGDSIYLFSDGYADQFGGEKDKKFGSKRMKELLIAVQNKPMNEQKIVVETTLQNWMKEGHAEQLDDVCVLGVRIQ